jgi:hypothetical protein
MLKHGAVTQFRIANAETQKETARTNDAETVSKADTVKSAIHVAETARELRC